MPPIRLLPSRLALSFVFALLSSSALHATQTENTGIHATPVTTPVVIDGDLKDWDLSGQTLICYDIESLKDVYSGRIAMMHDDENLYVSIHWKDDVPMGNSHDPQFQAGRGWAADSVQMRLKTDRISHITAWYYAPKNEPFMNIGYGSSLTEPFGGGEIKITRTEGWKMTKGAEMAFKADADGKGYVQEMKLPWSLITDKKAYRAGDKFSCGIELLWGEADWPAHRYADNLNEGTTSREFFWTAHNNWGPVFLESKGNLNLPEPAYLIAARQAEAPAEGVVDINYDLPKEARVTLAIDDENGTRIRNLTAAALRPQGKNTEKWDGLGDNGRAVPPGNYRFKAIYHDGIHVNYVMSFASPGNPTWDTSDNKGSFYGDHAAPQAAAAGGDFVALAGPIGEAGKHIIGVNLDGQRQWGLDHRLSFSLNRISLATDGKLLWVSQDSSGTVYRVDIATGKYIPWKKSIVDAEGKSTEVVDLPVTSPRPKAKDAHTVPVNLASIAVGGGRLAVALTEDNLVKFFDADTGEEKGSLEIPSPRSVAAATNGNWLVLTQNHLLLVSPDGKTTPFSDLDFTHAHSVTRAPDGLVYVSVRGTDQNVKVLSPEGRLLREIGVRGGRPANGVYNPDGMLNPAQIAVDSRGQLWVAEENMNPKRTSVWDARTGTLLKDLAGTTTYSGAGGIDPANPSIGFSNNTIYHIDLTSGTWKPIYSLADSPSGPDDLFPATVQSRSRVVNHGADTYIYMSSRIGEIRVVLDRAGEWRPVAALGYVSPGRRDKEIGVDYTRAPFASNPGKFYTWADRNGDALVQPDEITFAQPSANGKPAEPSICYWGTLPGNNGTVTIPVKNQQTLFQFPITGYTQAGAPIYDIAQPKVLTAPDGMTPNGKNLAMVMTGKDDRVYLNQEPLTVVNREGAVIATYPSAHVSVHGSHTANAARPGYLIGPNSILGTADLGKEIGEVFSLNGNLGQNFLFTEDALWIQTLFKDTRLPTIKPDRAIRGMNMDAITAGSESFGGYFAKTADGKIYLVIGSTDARVLEVTGLDSIRRFNGSFVYTPQQFTLAQTAAQEKLARESVASTAQIIRTSPPPVIDGKASEWPELLDNKSPDALSISESARKAFGRVALRWDDQNLYMAWRVIGPQKPRNVGQDWHLLFKTGDAVDLMIGPDSSPKGIGNSRLLIAFPGGKPVVVLNQKVAPDAPKSEAFGFGSPWRTITFDRVVKTDAVTVATGSLNDGHLVEASIPWATLGLTPKAGLKLKGDAGLLFSDSSGTQTVSRQYWSNKATGLVSDIPGEADLTPALWGTFELK